MEEINEVQANVLRAIAANDGRLYWRRLLDTVPACKPIFDQALNGLLVAGLVEIRPFPPLGDLPRYWLTEQGRAALLDQPFIVGGVKQKSDPPIRGVMNRDELVDFARQLGLVAHLREMGVPAISLFDQCIEGSEPEAYRRGAFIFADGEEWEFFAPPTPANDQRLSTDEIKERIMQWAKNKLP